MENRVGFRFIPTDEEIVDYYLRLKNLGGDTSHHVNLLFMQENRNDYRPKMSLTGFIDHSDDENSDSDLISATTTVSLILLW
uniref:Uncharacterized protein n=1 Tax=Brassica campestris TaxID=3711 RepID=A0A3P6CQ49_BRACM|nr:unnamed protein product [Brassica rapa]